MGININKYSCVYIDSPIFIYFIEEHPEFIQTVRNIFQQTISKNILTLSSYLSLLEILIKPIKTGNYKIASQYRDFMLNSRSLRLFPLDEKVAEKAACLRANYNTLKTPDAIQLATAILNNAETFITNDRQLKQIKEIQVTTLDDFV